MDLEGDNSAQKKENRSWLYVLPFRDKGWWCYKILQSSVKPYSLNCNAKRSGSSVLFVAVESCNKTWITCTSSTGLPKGYFPCSAWLSASYWPWCGNVLHFACTATLAKNGCRCPATKLVGGFRKCLACFLCTPHMDVQPRRRGLSTRHLWGRPRHSGVHSR